MAIGAIMGLKKMVTSPFGPAILLAIPAFTVIGFFYIDNKQLESAVEQYRMEAAAITVSRDIAKGEAKKLRSRIGEITSDIKRKEELIVELESKAKESAESVIIESEKSAIAEKQSTRNSEEMGQWYKEVWQ